jgi:four helix bundle protein
MDHHEKPIKNFTDLYGWRVGHELVIMVYKITKNFPKEEIFGLTSQMRRSSISITSNIAEGFSRKTAKDKSHFYYMAKGSNTELQDQLYVARDIGYIDNNVFQEYLAKSIESLKLINSLITSCHKHFT